MLVALWDVSNQFNDNNGSILTNGKIYVYYSGRAALAPTWSSADGSHVNPNPIIIDNNGRAVAFADDQYTYTCVVCDFYGKELFSFDPASFGTGGGGSTTEGNDAAHWIGASGTDVQVTALVDTLLPMPSSPDYEGDFVGQTTYTTISLNKGLYMVDADIRIQQDDDDLENIIKDISVHTGLTGPDSLTTSQKNWTGPEASDDRHFVHVHFIRHIADEGEDLYFQVNSPVDLSQAWIEKLSIVKLTEGGNGKNYVGGYGIDITGPVISVSGMIPEASAANFVDVSTYNTDIENIYETIAETSAMIPSGVATEQWVTDYTSAFITEDALEGYATQQWIEDQHYITSADIPPIPQDVVTSGELATVSGDIVSQIPSLDGYATQNWVQDQGYLTSVPEEYVTQTEMENYVESETSSFITSADLPSLDGYATEQYVQDYTSAFITSADVPHLTQEQADWNEDDPSAPDYIKNKPTIPSLEGYATEQYVQDYTSAFITSADIPDVPEDLVTSAELATVSGDIVSRIPSLDGYATEQWVGEQGYLTSIPEDLVTSAELASVSGDIVSQIPDVSDMATKTWVGQQGYLTSIPAEYATSGDLVTLSGAIEADIPSYTAGDNISIVSDTISVSGTAGLIAGDNVTITASGDNYVISSTGGGSDVDIIPSLSSGTKIADYVIDGTSGALYAPAGGGGGATYTATAPIAIDDSNNISIKYGNTLVVTNYTNTDTAESNYYGNMTLQLIGEPSESDNLQIYTSSNLRVNGTAGNHLRLRIDLDDTDNYINSKVNLLSGSQEITLTGTTQTISGFQTPTGSTWADIFDFSVHPISDMYPSQATYGEVFVELWEYNGDTPVRPWYGTIGTYWPEGISVEFTSSNSNLNVANPMPAPSYNANYVLTSNGYGGSYWGPAKGASYNGVYPIQVSSNYISFAHDSTLGNKQTSVISATGEDNGYNQLGFLPLGAVPSDSDPCQIQGSSALQVTGTAGNTVRLRFFNGPDNFIDMAEELVDENGDVLYLTGSSQTIQIRSAESTWGSLFDFSNYTIEDLWDQFPTIELWEYDPNEIVPVNALKTGIWASGFTLDFNSSSTTFGVTDPLPASTSADNNKVLTVVSGAPAWSNAPAGGLDQVYHDAGMTGAGTSQSPLSITSADIWNAAAGMNEYPISAGPGMSIEDVSGVTVFQTSGTMMDDLIEYNSQDEISGYNGHPVMTVDSEKQWLNHDDTICHVTNSAQYAFGVNVPVVAQAMGTDETVLYSGPNVAPSSTAIALSGNINDFNSVKFYWNANNYVGDIVDEVQCDNSTTQLTFMHPAGASNLWIQFLAMNCPTGVNKNSLTLLAAKQINFGSWSSTTWSNPTVNTNVGDTFMLSKVVGIGRKENT